MANGDNRAVNRGTGRIPRRSIRSAKPGGDVKLPYGFDCRIAKFWIDCGTVYRIVGCSSGVSEKRQSERNSHRIAFRALVFRAVALPSEQRARPSRDVPRHINLSGASRAAGDSSPGSRRRP